MNLTPNLALEVKNAEYKDRNRLWQAIQLSQHCIPVTDAFSVGAIVYDAKGNLVSTGYSREIGERSHAEEVALLKAQKKGADLTGGTIYSSLEPCGKRSSSNKTCTERIIEAGITKIVFALREPTLFVSPAKMDRFENANIKAVQITEYASAVREINSHLI